MALFSERNGYVSVDKTIVREDVPEKLRIALWNVMRLQFSMMDLEMGYPNLRKLIREFWEIKLVNDMDVMPDCGFTECNEGYNFLKNYFISCNWNEALDFIEFCADKSSFAINRILKKLNKAFERENSAYRLIGNQIAEITDENQIEAIKNAQKIPSKPVQIHLSSALAKLSDRNNPDYRNSIKESISAVEAICKEVTGKPKATLGDALKEIKNLHPALKSALSSLYGYTSDTEGIRHSLIKDEIYLTRADATFMLVSCSAFISLLVKKTSAQV